MQTMRKPIPSFGLSLKAAARRSLCLASDWAVRNQVRDAWPFWDSNKGRFPYHILIDPKKRAKVPMMWSTCWKTARTVQGLYSAYSATGKKEYLDAANRGLEYVASLQFFEPGYEEFHGAFREDSTQGPHLAYRDGIEAVQALINGYLVTKDERYLRRAVLGAEFVLREFRSPRFPSSIFLPLEGSYTAYPQRIVGCFCVGAIIFAQLSKLTGERRWVTKGAVPMMDRVLRDFVLPNGALGVREEPGKTHHVGASTPLGNVLTNDDGIGVAMLSTWAVTGRKKYLDAAVGWADFWLSVDEEPERLAAFPSLLLFVADVYRLTRDRKYLPLLSRFARRTLELQCIRPKDPLLHGAFIGEDMAARYDRRTKPTDWVDLRVTSYALIALAKLAAERPSGWGCAYSCFGW